VLDCLPSHGSCHPVKATAFCQDGEFFLFRVERGRLQTIQTQEDRVDQSQDHLGCAGDSANAALGSGAIAAFD